MLCIISLCIPARAQSELSAAARESLAQFSETTGKRYRDERAQWMEAGNSYYELRIDWARELDSLGGIVQQEQDALQRHAAAFAWLTLVSLAPAAFDSTLMEKMLEAIPITSLLWDTGADIAPSVIGLAASYHDRGRLQRYFTTVAERHPSENARMQMLYNLAQEAWWAQDRAGVERYTALLEERFPNAHVTADARRDFPSEANIVIGRLAPDFLARDIDDTARVFSKSSFRGKYVLWDFWFPGCKPCVAEMPFLHKAHERFGARGLQIVSSCTCPEDDLAQFRKKWPMPWLHLRHIAWPSLANIFETVYYPRTVLVDPDGVIIAIDEKLHGNRLLQTLEHFMGSGGTDRAEKK